MEHTCTAHTLEVEEEESGVQGHSLLLNKLEARLGYSTPFQLKTKTNNCH